MKIVLNLQFLTCKKYSEHRSTVKNCNFSRLQFFKCTSTVIPLHIFAVCIAICAICSNSINGVAFSQNMSRSWRLVNYLLKIFCINYLSFFSIHVFTASFRRACGHVDEGTCPHQVLAVTLTLSQPGGQIMPTLYTGVHTKFWKPHARLKYNILHKI